MSLARWNAALAVLAVVLLIPVIWTWNAEASTFTPIDRIPLLFEGLDPDRITRIQLSSGQPEADGASPLERAGADAGGPAAGVSQGRGYRELNMIRRGADQPWRMGPGPAIGALIDSAQVQVRVLDHLLGVQADPDRIVDASPDGTVLAEHGLTMDAALRIRAYQGQQLAAELWVGKPSGRSSEESAVRGVYIRGGGSDAIRLYEGARFDRGLDVASWLDRRLFQFELGSVESLRIRSPFIPSSNGLGFRKKPGSDATWEASDPPEGVGDLLQQRVTNTVTMLARMQAAGVGELVADVDLATLGLDAPEVEVAVQLKDGEVVQLSASRRIEVPGGGVARFAIVSGRLRIVELRDLDVRPFRKGPTEWFGPAK